MAIRQGHRSALILMDQQRKEQERIAFTQHGIDHRTSASLLEVSSNPLTFCPSNHEHGLQHCFQTVFYCPPSLPKP